MQQSSLAGFIPVTGGIFALLAKLPKLDTALFLLFRTVLIKSVSSFCEDASPEISIALFSVFAEMAIY